ncbi:MAG: hypothetical protein K2H37_15200 [Lachnospiraceae bacterium]|nr:hypothetical protein [Lachnospiraceae bacterium]
MDTESEITVEYVNDPTTDTANNTAEVVFLGGCVSSDKKLAKDRDLRFKVEPAAGRVLTTVAHQIGDAASATPITATGGIYTVAKSAFIKGTGDAATALSGKIIVTTKAVNYKVSFDGTDSAAGSYEIYPVVEKSETDKTEVLGTKIGDSDKADVAYGKSAKFALVLTDKDGVVENKIDSITLNGENITTTPAELNKKDDAAEAAKTKCVTFTVDPSKAGDLGDAIAEDTAAEVIVKVVAKAKLTVAFDSENANSTVAASVTNTGDTFINYSGSGFGTDSTFVEDDATNLAKSLAFKVTPSANYKITDITAKATTAADEEGTAVPVTKGTAATDDGSVECTIALSGVGSFSANTDLTISIATALDDTKDSVHTINFKDKNGNAPAHVAITHGASNADEELAGSSLTVTGDTYKISVDPAAGYELTKGGDDDKDGANASLKDKQYVTIIENRKYESTTAQGTYDDVKTYTHKEDISTAITLTLADTANGDTNYEADATDNRKFITTSVDVVIDAAVQKNDGEKIVHFDDQLGAGYKITADGVIHDEEAADEENTWVVPESVDVLSFTVTSVQKPTVTVDDVETEGTAAENVYTFSVPAMALSDDSGNPSEIVIDAEDVVEEKSVKVKVVADDVTVKSVYDGVETEESLDDEVDGYYTLAVAPEEGSDLTLNFVPKPGVTIDKVSYTMGETTGEAAPDRKGNVALTLTVTDDVTVDVESKSDYRVKLTIAGEELAQDGAAYVADYTDTNIDIELTKAGVSYTQDLYDVVVKDGAKTAATEATVNGAKATIAAIDSTERGKDLTIEVYINKSTKYTTTLKTNAVSDEVTVSRMVNGKDTKIAEDATVEIMPDAKMTFGVAPAKGASLSDLDVEILAKDGTALAAANTPVERVIFENGELTVQTKPGVAKDTEVLVSIFNKNAKTADGKEDKTALKGGKFVLKLTDSLVKTAEVKSVTAVAGSGTNRAVRLNVNVDFKNKKSLPAPPVQGDLYYKVELTAPTGAPTGVTVISGADLVQYVKIDDFENPAATLTIPLVVSNSADANGAVADIAEVISTTAKVTLVQSLKETPAADADYVAGPEAVMKDNTLSTKAPIYETKLTVKSVNGATVFTGQTDAKVAIPVFGKTTAYDNISVQFVDTKTGVRYGSSYAGFSTRVDTDNSILVSADASVRVNRSDYKNMLKTFGVKVTAVAPDESYAASAVVKLKVQQGIYDVDVDESKAKLPETIFKDAKKAASVKITPLLNEGIKDYKPAKATVRWEIVPAWNNKSTYAAAALTGKKPLVSVKNGTVSIAKDYQVQAEELDNRFTVTITPIDFVGNTATPMEVTFEITDQKNEIGKLVVLDADGNVKDPASLTAEEFDYWNHQYNNGTDDESKYLYVVALKKGVKDADSYTNDEDFLPVTFKSGNAKALAVNTASGLLTFSKPADKIKITATTVDGGKAPKAELVINVKPYNQVGLGIAGVNGSWSGLDETDLHYSGGNNEMYELYPHYSTDDGWNGISDYKNLKITVKGGKFIANKNWAKGRGNYMGYAVVVTDKSGKATITVTDTANKNKAANHKDYTITNDSFTTVKAPSIKLFDPKKVTAGTEEITWQVTDKNNDNYAGSYVKLTPDFTVTASNPAYNIVDEKGTILKIDENGRFTLIPGYLYGGAYKMIATVGTMVGGEFVASAKDVKLSFSIPVKKYKTNLTVKGNYTLDAKGASYAVIDVKSDYVYEISDAMNVIKKVQDKDDHTNRFTDFFEVNALEDEDGYVYAYTIGLKSGLSAEQIEYITSKDGKDDCTGYITVSNGWGSMDSLSGRYNTKDVQVKISFKANKYSLTGATIFSNGTATTPVTATVRLMNGKVRDYAALVAVDATDDGRFAAATNALSFKDGDIVITSKAAAIEPGKYDVKLIVVPQSSSFVKWDETTQKWVYANDKTENGKVLTEAELIAKAGIPVTAKIDVKAVDTRSIAKAKSLNVTLRTDDKDIIIWNNADNNTSGIDGTGYVQATATTGGYYQVDVPYSIAAAGSDIAADGVKVNLTKNEVDQNKVTVAESTTEDLVKAVKAVTRDGEPVIRLQVSKKALVALTNMPRTDKPITGYGKKLKVPVEIKYTNGITTTDTLNFNITMPKNAPADFATVQKTIADNKAAIEKIQTKLYGYAAYELQTLFDDVYTKVNGLIPADTDVKVNYELNKKHLNDGKDVVQGEEEDTPDYDGIMTEGKAKVTLTLTDVSKAADNTADVSWNYTLGMHAESSDVTDAVSAIESATLTYTNETTAASLLAEIKADEGVKPYLDARKGHLSLKVASFYKNPATIKGNGSIAASIQVKDLVTGESGTANLESYIDRLSNLTEAKAAVGGLFDNASKVLAFVDACSGQEAVMKEAILKAANDAAANKDITIAFKADTDTKKGWDYKPATADAPAVNDKDGNEITPAVTGEDGHLSFTLVLTKKQADGSRSAEIASTNATIVKADAEKYVSLTAAKAKIAAEVADATEYTKLKALVATASSVNDADAIKTVIAGKLDTEVANYKGYSWDWAKTADNKDDFTYTAATQTAKGKLSFQIVLTLDGAKDAGLATGVTETISVTDVEVVDAADAYQTAEELKAEIEKIGTTAAPITAATVPADKAAAKTALDAEITKVNKATPAITVVTENVAEAEGVTATTYTASPSGEGETATKGEYKNVKITIGTGDDAIEFTHDFNFAVTPAEGA